MRPDRHAGYPEPGAWIPWNLYAPLVQLRLKPSRWQVLLAILLPWYRFDQKVVFLTIKQISERTGRCKRTVQYALSDLVGRGIVRRIGRRGKLVVVAEAIKSSADSCRVRQHLRQTVHVSDRQMSRHKGDGPRRSCSTSRSSTDGGSSTFTLKQRAAIEGCFGNASELLDEDARGLSVPESVVAKLGLEAPISYGQAYQILDQAGRSAACGAFVRAVLKLQTDERVQGRELDLSNSE
jgi:hypothetical protein